MVAPGVGPKPALASAKALAESIGLRSTPAALSALSALAGERLPLERQAALGLLRVMAEHGDDPAAARAAARAMAAGLDPESPALGAILSFLSENDSSPASARPDALSSSLARPRDEPGEQGHGRGGGNDAGDGRDASDASDERDTGSSQGDCGSDTGHGGSDRRGKRDGAPSVASAERSAERPVEQLAGLLETLAVAALKDQAYRGLQRPARDGSGWVCLPFSLTFDGMAFHGFFRICYDSTRRVERFVADVRSGGHRRLLELSGSGSSLALRYGAEDEAERAGFMERFSREARVTCQPTGDAYATELVARRSVDEDA